MSSEESYDRQESGRESGQESGRESARTGVAAVDAVLEAVDQASQLPLDEQVAVFERAHEGLRRALDSTPDGPAPDGPADQRPE